MGERKVINKYYPPDFDPSKIPRRKKARNMQTNDHIMLPLRIQCNKCGHYMGEGKKFNSRKEIVSDDSYLGVIKLFRFYFKCSDCSNEIIMKTDPRNSGYVIEAGARQCYQNNNNFQVEEEVESSMEKLERKTISYKKEMKELDELTHIKSINALYESVSNDNILKFLQQQQHKGQEHKFQLDEEDEALVKCTVFVRKRVSDADADFDHRLKRNKLSTLCQEKETSAIIPTTTCKFKVIKQSSKVLSSFKSMPTDTEEGSEKNNSLALLSQTYSNNIDQDQD